MKLSSSVVRFCALIALACAMGMMSACGGGGSSITPPPPTTTFTVTANAGTGTTATPASASVDAGKTATFTFGLKDGYKDLVVTGCTLTGNSCVVSPVSNMTLSSSATLIPVIPTYSVSLTLGAGTTAVLPVTSVQDGQTITLTGVGLLPNYQNLIAVGCVISGTTCVTPVAHADVVITLLATKIPVVTYTVSVTADAHIHPTSMSVTAQDGQPATIYYTADPGVVVKSATGCTLSAVDTTGTVLPTCVVSSVNSNMSVHLTGTSVGDAYVLNWMKITPNTLFDDEFQTAPVTIYASTYGALDHMGVCYFPSWFDKNLPVDYVCNKMSDGGMSNGEHLYVLSFPNGIGIVPALRFYNGTADYLLLSVTAYDAANNELSPSVGSEIGGGVEINNQLNLGVVSRSLSVSTTEVASNVFAAPNMVNVVLPYSATGYEDVDALAEVYKHYPDSFRVGVVQTIGSTRNFNVPHGGPANSGGGLPGINTLECGAGENPGDILMLAFLHERGHCHAWDLNKSALNIADMSSVHMTLSSMQGQMAAYNYTLSQQPNGSFNLVPNAQGMQNTCKPYSNWELYLNEFLTLSDVEPEYFLTDQSVLVPGAWPTNIPASAVTLVTSADLVRVYGTTIQKDGSNPTIVVGLSDRKMTDAEFALLNRVSVYLTSNEVDSAMNTYGLFPVCSPPAFSVATKGNGTMTSTVPTPNK